MYTSKGGVLKSVPLGCWMSSGMMVTRLAWMAHKLVSSKRGEEVEIGGLLQGQDGGSLEAQVVLQVLGDLAMCEFGSKEGFLVELCF